MQILDINDKQYISDIKAEETIYIPLPQYLKDGKVLNVVDSKDNARTVKQNNSMHKYLAIVAKKLNDAGLDIKQVIKADVSWTTTSVKELMWRVIQIAMFSKKSTTSLKTDEVTQIHKIMDNHLVSRLGIEPTDFPSVESMIFEQNNKMN